MSELDKIAERYKRRAPDAVADKFSIPFTSFIVNEREGRYRKEILKHFDQINNLKILEIGAGGGSNLYFFKDIGILPENIFANELLPERIEQLRLNHPDVHIIEGDACEINENEKFDIVFQSTVFTSILDEGFRIKLAERMQSLVKKNGIILWYDFVYNNPSNNDVKRVSKNEILKLFNGLKKIEFFPVTLAPPIGRKIGTFYTLINKLFPFLRTHVIAVIQY